MKNGRYVEYGNICYYEDNELHREDGPAVEYTTGSKAWYTNGEYHREDGPAVEYSSGSKSWYYYGTEAEDKEEFFSDKFRKGALLDLV